ncbi:uncharacterized protein LOC134934541 [Pseudophryne corroboree]|uniref:uncharacterized protein LOC134934541 n=1 Tax=Pseudophryne corroboree TaxID=495146 RepID=UPI0030816AA2
MTKAEMRKPLYPWLQRHKPRSDWQTMDVLAWDLKIHREQVKEVLSCLRKNHLFCKLEKWTFEIPSITFLGYVISGQELQMDSTKVQAICDWTLPTTLKGIQQFLGFANLYRKFIKNYSIIITPITMLTRKGANPSMWPPKAPEAFMFFKEAFMSAPILCQPDLNRPFQV